MSEVSTWNGYAYVSGEPDPLDEHRVLADWQVEDFVRWARSRGFDQIYLYRRKEKTRFGRRPVQEVKHTWHKDAA